MYFNDLQCALLGYLRLRVFNGEFTERQLARIVGVSQPHIHNVLKGNRFFSIDLSDRVLRVLGITVLNLVDPLQVESWVRQHPADDRSSTYLRVLDGLLGPGQPWPTRVSGSLPFPIRSSELVKLGYPVAARLADDPNMHPVFSAGDWVTLDQSIPVRRHPDEDSFYLLKLRDEPLIRRIRSLERVRYIVTEASAHNPGAWERVDPGMNLLSLIRARVRFLPPGPDWWEPDGLVTHPERATSR